MSLRVVCFDLGGVLVDVCHTWDEAMAHAGMSPGACHRTPLSRVEAFVQYQAGRLTDKEYLEKLSRSLGLTIEEAALAHAHILRDEVADVLAVVEEVHEAGWATGCLSNTNALHWEELLSGRFPAIASLHWPMASHLVRSAKPEPEIYAEFESVTGAKGREITYFDDVQEYVEAARCRGWIGIEVDPLIDRADLYRQSVFSDARPL